MVLRTWVIQILGLSILASMIFYTIPKLTFEVSDHLQNKVKQILHNEGMDWVFVQATDRNIALRGTVLSIEEHQRAIELARSVLLVKDIDDQIKPAPVNPYLLSLQKTDSKLEVSGYLPTDEDRNKIQQLIQQIFKGLEISSELKTGVGAPEAWVKLVETLLLETGKLELASINITGKTLEATGKIAKTTDIESFRKTLQPFIDKGYHLKIELSAADHAKIICQQKFNELLASEKIYFETGKAVIDHRSDQLLQKLTDNAIFCANSKIIIAGHTDDVGSEAANQELSYQRATAVKGALFTLGGISLERLDAVGKGSTEPVDTNDTEESRAKNRRIEFIVEDMK